MAATTLVLLATVAAVTHPAQAVSRSTPSRNISPVVLATWFAVGADQGDVLELLVLWRGTPGWFMQGGGTGGGALPGSAGQIGVVLRASPAVVSFLRCDARRADGRGDGYLARLCPQALGLSDSGQVAGDGAPQSGLTLSSLTVPAAALGGACHMLRVPATGASIADVGNARIIPTHSSLWRVPDNPWVGSDPGILVQLRKRIDGGYTLPLSPPPTAAERATMDRSYGEHVVRGYQALYETNDGRVVAQVRAIEFDDPSLAARRPASRAASASVRLVRDAAVVLLTGESETECHRIVEAHVREHFGRGH